MTPGKICEPFCCRAPVALERWNLTLIVDGYCTATCPIEHVVLFQQCDVKGPALASKRLDMKCIKSRTCLLQVFPPFISFFLYVIKQGRYSCYHYHSQLDAAKELWSSKETIRARPPGPRESREAFGLRGWHLQSLKLCLFKCKLRGTLWRLWSFYKRNRTILQLRIRGMWFAAGYHRRFAKKNSISMRDSQHSSASHLNFIRMPTARSPLVTPASLARWQGWQFALGNVCQMIPPGIDRMYFRSAGEKCVRCTRLVSTESDECHAIATNFKQLLNMGPSSVISGYTLSEWMINSHWPCECVNVS